MTTYKMLADEETYLWQWQPRLRKWRKKVGIVTRPPRTWYEGLLVRFGLREFPIRNKYVYKEQLADHDRIDMFGPSPEGIEAK